MAFATGARWAGLTPSDRQAASVLVRAGIAVTAAVWDATDVDWRGFDAVVIRSCWDYHLRWPEFDRWLGRLEAAGVAVWNPPATVRWNAHKGYLLELERHGVPVVPTALVPAGAPLDLPALARRFAADELVVKPAVSASAYLTRRLAPGRPEDAAWALAQGAERDLLVQPFLPEVSGSGEWSLVFVGGAPSHAVRKQPAGGDFRVQEELGGRTERVEPDAALGAVAAAALRCAPTPVLYGRADLVVVGGRALLMELELIEPELFFGLAPEAAGRFRDALLTCWRGSSP